MQKAPFCIYANFETGAGAGAGWLFLALFAKNVLSTQSIFANNARNSQPAPAPAPASALALTLTPTHTFTPSSTLT